MSVGSKIRELRKARKMTISQLAELTGWDVGNISRLERGIQGYSEQSLKKIADALNINLSELFSDLHESGTVHKNSEFTLPVKTRSDVYRVDIMNISASAGTGITSNDFIEVISSIEYLNDEARRLFGNRPSNQVKLINVRGDSMQGTIDPGDLIFVDISVNYFDGDGIYIFNFNGDLFVKRLQRIKSEIVVLSDNHQYKEWHICSDESHLLHICGKVLLSQSQNFRRHS